MVFVSRAERKLNEFVSTSVGPGSYNLSGTPSSQVLQSLQGFAPFASTSTRNLFEEKSFIPGPGSYDLQRPRIKASRGPKISSSPRFKEKNKSESPGPGSYSNLESWKTKKIYSRPLQASSCNRLPSAPSIPATHQSYGYEETLEGDLIMHTSPEDIHTGLQKDSVGPGHYSIKHSTGPAVCWFKSKSKRYLNHFDPTGPEVGPGSYNEITPIAPLYKFKQSAAFLSKYKEDSVEKDPSTDLPGPGSYELNRSTQKRYKARFQNFGSSSIRFGYKRGEKSLGPGSYSVETLSPKKVSKTPFDTSNIRFKYSSSSSTPGPGSYEGGKSGQGPAKGKKKSAFGTNGKRFMNLGKFFTPGPGQYAEKKPENYLTYKTNAVFASQSKRLT